MALYRGTNVADDLNGGGSSDRFCGLAGNDVIRGGGGNDVATGDAGDDTIDGGAKVAEADRLYD